MERNMTKWMGKAGFGRCWQNTWIWRKPTLFCRYLCNQLINVDVIYIKICDLANSIYWVNFVSFCKEMVMILRKMCTCFLFETSNQRIYSALTTPNLGKKLIKLILIDFLNQIEHFYINTNNVKPIFAQIIAENVLGINKFKPISCSHHAFSRLNIGM